MEGVVTWAQVCLHLVAVVVTMVAVIVGGLSLYLTYVYRKYAHIPQPPRESFFFGHALTVANKLRSGTFFGEVIRQYALELGPTYVLIMIGHPLVITVEQEAVKDLLVTGNYRKSQMAYKDLGTLYGQRFIGRGLVTETVTERWSKRRMDVNPAFHRQQLRSLMGDFNQTADDLMVKLSEQADGQTVVTMADSLNRATLDVIGKVAFNMDINSLTDTTSPFPAAIFKCFKGFSERNKSVISHKIPFMNRKFKQEVRDAIKFLRETGATIIEQREKDEAKGIPVPTDVISFVMDARKNDPTYTLEDTLDDFVTLFLAGQETTANAMGFTIRELGRHPEILKRVQAEVDAVIGERHDIQFEDINKLEYTNLVIKESLRLFPPIQLTFREMGEDHTLGGYLIPKGTSVATSQYAISRMEEYTPDALTFDPERFRPDSDKRPPTYAYFPFSLGPRNCIGMTFAQIEAKVILAKFIQRFNYKLDPSQSMEIEENTTLRPKDGCRVILTQRDM